MMRNTLFLILFTAFFGIGSLCAEDEPAREYIDFVTREPVTIEQIRNTRWCGITRTVQKRDNANILVTLCIDGQRILSTGEYLMAIANAEGDEVSCLVNDRGEIKESKLRKLRGINLESIREFSTPSAALQLMRLVRKTGWCDPGELHRPPRRSGRGSSGREPLAHPAGESGSRCG